MYEKKQLFFLAIFTYAVFITILFLSTLFQQNNSNEQEENNISICGICLDKFYNKNKPLILLCGHTFCARCLTQLLETTTKKIKCPLCQSISILPNTGLPVNYQLQTLIDLNTRNQNQNQTEFIDRVSCDAFRNKNFSTGTFLGLGNFVAKYFYSL